MGRRGWARVGDGTIDTGQSRFASAMGRGEHSKGRKGREGEGLGIGGGDEVRGWWARERRSRVEVGSGALERGWLRVKVYSSKVGPRKRESPARRMHSCGSGGLIAEGDWTSRPVPPRPSSPHPTTPHSALNYLTPPSPTPPPKGRDRTGQSRGSRGRWPSRLQYYRPQTKRAHFIYIGH